MDITDTLLHFNLIAFATFSWYFKSDITKQTAIAYISTAITFIIFVGRIVHHLILLIKKHKRKKSEHHLSALQPHVKTGVTI